MELIFGTKRFCPYDYGKDIVELCSRSSQDLVVYLISEGSKISTGDSLFSRMKLRPRLAQIPLMALHIAHYYIDAELRLKFSANDLVDLYQGITESLRSDLPDKTIMDMVENAMQIFGASLYTELTEPPEDLGFNNPYGPTAELAFGVINDFYEKHNEFHGKQLNISSMDELLAMASIHVHNAALMTSIINSKLKVASNADTAF